MNQHNRLDRQQASTARVVLVAVVWGLAHSALASNSVKQLVLRIGGARLRYGLYRFAYVIGAIVSTLGFIVWFVRQPDRVLYEVRAPWAGVMRGVQVAALAILADSVVESNLFRMTGIAEVGQLLGGQPIEPETVAQGPARDSQGQLITGGVFQWTRHAGDLSTIGLFWFFPRMTINLAVLAALATGYSVIGAFREEARLHKAYGGAFERYQQRVPFLLPIPKRRSR